MFSKHAKLAFQKFLKLMFSEGSITPDPRLCSKDQELWRGVYSIYKHDRRPLRKLRRCYSLFSLVRISKSVNLRENGKMLHFDWPFDNRIWEKFFKILLNFARMLRFCEYHFQTYRQIFQFSRKTSMLPEPPIRKLALFCKMGYN